MLIDHAKRELVLAGIFEDGSDYDGLLGSAVMQLITVFSEQGHSGFSAGQTVGLFSKLARFQPLTPLTGEDHEWNEIGDGLFQNNRCSHVFKQDGNAYDIDGKVFREPNGACYTNSNSQVPITFPYTPSTEYVDVPAEGDAT